ncbi:MAG: hypothetical protein J6Y48_00200, partial [Clostridia bacterium]|nr:hypothetical protein [Clostridia bacterium]
FLARSLIRRISGVFLFALPKTFFTRPDENQKPDKTLCPACKLRDGILPDSSCFSASLPCML